MNRGMLGAGELCITFHNYNTHWDDKLERHLFSLGERTFPPDSKQVRYKLRSTVNFTEFDWFSVINEALATCGVIKEKENNKYENQIEILWKVHTLGANF